MSPASIYTNGSTITGFSLLGQGTTNANASGFHIGDIVDSLFMDLSVDNFRGANSSCVWFDNVNGGIFERNTIFHVDAGLAPGQQNGCTKAYRWTSLTTSAISQSFAHNDYIADKFSIFDGQAGVSVEGGNHVGIHFTMTGNVSTGTTAKVYSISGATYVGSGVPTTFDGNIDVPVECTPPCTTAVLYTIPATFSLSLRDSGAGFYDLTSNMTQAVSGNIIRVVNSTINGAGETLRFMGQAFSGSANHYDVSIANPAVSSRPVAWNDCGAPCAFLFGGTNLLISPIAPTIAGGFGTSPSITVNNGTASFSINVGTGGTASSGTIGLPTATTAWHCTAFDITNPTTGGGYYVKQISGTASTVVLNGFNAAGALTAWTASDILSISCFAR
jgi:hypothetical protein